MPGGKDQTVYLVIDDLGYLGEVLRETGIESTDLEAVINDLLEGQYRKPVRVIAFNAAEGWSRDVSEDIAHELRWRSVLQLTELPECLQDFVSTMKRATAGG
ncbi:hypothetical protein ACFIOY_29685 [Bradyrhizobium sp. TZ2]